MHPLPPLPSGHGPWASNVHEAYKFMLDNFHCTSSIFQQDADAKRLKFHTENATKVLVPILQAFETHAAEENIPLGWVHECTEVVGELIVGLCQAQETTLVRYGIPVSERLY
jgi:hypothetical protein